MRTVKEQNEIDLQNIFHDTSVFAEPVTLKYLGKHYHVNAVKEYAAEHGRKRPSSDHADGLFNADLRLFVQQKDVDFVPKHTEPLTVDGITHSVIKVKIEVGELVIDLRRTNSK